MITLAEVLYQLAKKLGDTRSSSATSAGTTTTLVDSSLNEPDDYFNDGTLFFLTGNLTGKTAIITDWALTSHTFTIPTQTAAPGSGAQYVAASGMRFPREAMVDAINDALGALGPLPQKYDNVALVVVENQLEYDLPTGVYNVKRVGLMDSSSTPDTYLETHDWQEEGTHLEFDYDALNDLNEHVGEKILLWYEAPAARVSLDADTIDNHQVDADHLTWEAAYLAAIDRMRFTEGSEPETEKLAALADKMRQETSAKPVEHMPKDSRWSGW